MILVVCPVIPYPPLRIYPAWPSAPQASDSIDELSKNGLSALPITSSDSYRILYLYNLV